MPLAIELAAARVPALSLEQIAARLGDSLDVLAAGSRTALHAPADAARHDRLEPRPAHRRGARPVPSPGGLRRRLHAGGGRGRLRRRRDRTPAGRRSARAAGRQVARRRGRASASVCSTPSASTPPSASRPPPSATPSAVRHLDWCLALAERARPAVGRPAPLAAHAGGPSTTTCAPALAFALRRDPQAALRLATSLWRFWLDRGYFAEGNRWLRDDAGRRARADAAARRGAARRRRPLAAPRRPERLPAPRQRRRHATTARSGDERATAAALYQHAMFEQSVSITADAEALFAEALALARRLGDDRLLAAATHASAMTAVVPRRHASGSRASCSRRSALLEAAPDDDTPFFDGVTFGMCLLHEGPDGRPRMYWEETIFLFHRFARAQAIGLRAQQPRLDRSRRWRPRAGAAPPSTRRSRASGACEDRRGRGAHPRPHGQPRALAGRLRGRARASGAALAIRRDLGERRAILSTRIGLGLLAMTAGDAPAGRALLSEALARARGGRRPAGDGRRADQLGDRRGAPRRATNRQRACTRTAARCWAFRGCSASRRGAAWRCMTSAWRSATSPVPRRRCSAHGRCSSPSATRAGCPTPDAKPALTRVKQPGA